MILAYPSVAAADVVNLDEFAVTNNGSKIFDDSFNRALPLAGGSGTFLWSGTTFANGKRAYYHVRGTIQETTANNGQAVLNTAKGYLVTLPSPPFVAKTLNVDAFLNTGTTTLTPSHAFKTVGLFDLAVPSPVLGAYFVGLTNSTPGSPARELEMRVRETSTGPVLQFEWLDFADKLARQIYETPITAAERANPEVELELALNTAGRDTITAYYAFGSGNTLSSFKGTLRALGSTGSGTNLFTATREFAFAGFGNFAPVPVANSVRVAAPNFVTVPEPSTWAMMLLGFGGLGFAGYRASRKGLAFAS
jgi:hypothetical protein